MSTRGLLRPADSLVSLCVGAGILVAGCGRVGYEGRDIGPEIDAPSMDAPSMDASPLDAPPLDAASVDASALDVPAIDAPGRPPRPSSSAPRSRLRCTRLR